HVVRSMCQERVPKPTLKLQKSWSGGLLVPPLDGVLGGQVWLVYTTSDQGFCTPWTYTRGVCYKQTISLLEPITVETARVRNAREEGERDELLRRAVRPGGAPPEAEAEAGPAAEEAQPGLAAAPAGGPGGARDGPRVLGRAAGAERVRPAVPRLRGGPAHLRGGLRRRADRPGPRRVRHPRLRRHTGGVPGGAVRQGRERRDQHRRVGRRPHPPGSGRRRLLPRACRRGAVMTPVSIVGDVVNFLFTVGTKAADFFTRRLYR